MKKFLIFAAMASVALASCVSDDSEDAVRSARKVCFTTPVLGTQTKAVIGEITGTTYPETESFMVYAKKHGVGAFGTTGWDASANFWEGAEEVTYSGGMWQTSTTHYWPEDGKDITFAAYSPANLTNVSYNSQGLKIENHSTTNIDIMYSGRIANCNEANSSANGVTIEFKHALASIVFTVTDNNAKDYTINSLKVTGTLATQGTFNENLTNFTTTSTPKWDNVITGSVEYQPISSSIALTHGTKTEITKDETALLLIPQSSINDAKVIINYTETLGASSVNKEVAVLLSDFKKDDLNSISKWDANNRYIYNITFGSSKIFFKPSITDWETVEASYSIK